jgi:hypothetical protein
MEITKERLIQLSKTNASAKVMIKQWYPDLFNDIDNAQIPSGVTLREAIRWNEHPERNTLLPPQLQLGKWYTDGEEHLMIFGGDIFNCKGFYNNSWNNTWLFPQLHRTSLATEQQIGDALRRYCRDNGYTSSNFESLATCSTRLSPIEDWYYSAFEDALYAAPEGRGGLCVYKQGRWARLHSQIEF